MQVTGRQSASPRPYSAGQGAPAADRRPGQAQLQLSQPQNTQEQAHYGQAQYGQRGNAKAMQPQLGPVSRPQPQVSTHWQQHLAARQPAGIERVSGPAQATTQPTAATVLQPLAPAMPGSLCKPSSQLLVQALHSTISTDCACRQPSTTLYGYCKCLCPLGCTSCSAFAVEAQMAGPDAHPELSLEVMLRRLQQEKDDLQRQ